MSKKYTVKELKKICKEKGIKGYSKLRKAELLKYCLKKQETKKKIKQEIKRKINDKLFDDKNIFQFYSKSRDKFPGEGSGEKLDKNDKDYYSQLNDIKDWRKKLSNFYESKFALDDKIWLSVEHFYQASKFKKNNKDFYDKFALDSKSELSRSSLMAKGAGGKTGKSRGKQIRPKNVYMDKDFFSSGRDKKEMYRAQHAKYTQNENLKKMLLMTGDAKLQHFSRGSKPIIFYNTMKIRKNIK